jgi:uncharacterized protein (DUF1800 family)
MPLGKFEELLIATAKSPAMLMYRDNFSSAATDTGVNQKNQRMTNRFLRRLEASAPDSSAINMINAVKNGKKRSGLNENYAREVMELHTISHWENSPPCKHAHCLCNISLCVAAINTHCQ